MVDGRAGANLDLESSTPSEPSTTTSFRPLSSDPSCSQPGAMSSQPEASTSRLLPASPAATSTPRASSSSASSSRLQLARQAALSQSSAGGDKHTQALVRASQNRTTAGGRSLDRQVILEVRPTFNPLPPTDRPTDH